MKSTIMRIEGFRSENLNNERDLFIYLPPGYTESEDRRYPVLYVHDGQNLFHPAMNGQSWNLHRTADRLIANGSIEEIIIVGIANMGAERANEFMHPLDGVLYQNDKENITPRGILYERFLIGEIKPYIDGMLRTKPGAADTALMGSSRGGKVTYHIGIRRPDVFGKLGILSPYFYYVNPLSLEEHRMYASFPSKSPLSKIWIDLGVGKVCLSWRNTSGRSCPKC
ncbi:alpha/beta hydrolase [Cohnella faecalis]|uniref:Esterase family protein n=1 Tax=Cohnella faecalis TaxID=2315694 RepID=A0A398CFS5_9BACL|nr:alpha/beta hydrolase-fold protein [Cohnella faecalis]RIE01285.1 esterase family protein [Cohnella faecalis]